MEKYKEQAYEKVLNQLNKLINQYQGSSDKIIEKRREKLQNIKTSDDIEEMYAYEEITYEERCDLLDLLEAEQDLIDSPNQFSYAIVLLTQMKKNLAFWKEDDEGMSKEMML